MKICFIELLPYPENIGGGSSYITGLGKALIKKGHDVTVLTTRDDDSLNYILIDGIKIWKLGMTRRKRQDYTGVKFAYFLFYRFFFELYFILSAAIYLRRNKFDIVNTQSPIHGSLACALFGIPYFMTAHGIYSEGFGDGLLARIFELTEVYTASKAKLVICLGKRTKNYYKQYGKCVVIPTGIDTHEFTYDESKKKNNILIYAGRFSKIKAVDGIIKAMDYLPKYGLFVIGYGPETENIEFECFKRENVMYLGKQDTKFIANRMMNARFVVLNSSLEGLPIMLLEGMGSGCIPITTYAHGDIKDLVNKTNGTLIKQGALNIARAIKSYKRKNLSNYSRMARKTIEERHDWNKIADTFINTYSLSNAHGTSHNKNKM